MVSSTTRELYSTPIKSRPPRTIADWLHLVSFNLIFGALLIYSHLYQLAPIPFAFIPFEWARVVFEGFNAHAKETFASSLIFIVSQFAPTKIILTAADDSIDLEKLVRRNEKGEIVGFNLEKQAVWMSNHQMYCDWIYPWCLLSYANVSSGLIIILKASLAWAPLVGPAMQLFDFCFIDKNRTLADSNLFSTALWRWKRNEPYQCLLFPEGTLYSSQTQPRSAKFAEKLGIPNAVNVLLPRTAGLLYTLRALTTVFGRETLAFYDLTVGYAGVPARGYAQDYYSIQSVFGLGIPPRTVHFHLRRIPLDSIPIGTVRSSARPKHIAEEISDDEKRQFEEWLRAEWRHKDDLMGHFGDTGEFEPGTKQGKVEWEIKMRRKDWAMLVSVPVGLVFFIVLYRPKETLRLQPANSPSMPTSTAFIPAIRTTMTAPLVVRWTPPAYPHETLLRALGSLKLCAMQMRDKVKFQLDSDSHSKQRKTLDQAYNAITVSLFQGVALRIPDARAWRRLDLVDLFGIDPLAPKARTVQGTFLGALEETLHHARAVRDSCDELDFEFLESSISDAFAVLSDAERLKNRPGYLPTLTEDISAEDGTEVLETALSDIAMMGKAHDAVREDLDALRWLRRQVAERHAACLESEVQPPHEEMHLLHALVQLALHTRVILAAMLSRNGGGDVPHYVRGEV
ncbi:hypothetical protein JCM10908_006915 [Rhodotorula pacifica]|uniref:lysophospholipid acyltransferase family protein n=1 Tax=Rhodotorula pacifica TaxID=1495444 RepID=UPI00316BCDD7